MKRTLMMLGLCLLMTSGLTYASDMVGCYAMIEKVVFEPTADAPERVQVWGIFSLATRNDGNSYEAPVKGYMYFTIKPGKADICKREWADLQKLAGKKECAAFGGRFDLTARVRPASQKAENPDVYSISSGVFPMRTNTDYAPIRSLLALANAAK